MSMDFLQVLIHQHAKTIVALQELQSEVTTLKDFRNSVLSSLPELKQSIPSERSGVIEKHGGHGGLSNGRATVGGSGSSGVGSAVGSGNGTAASGPGATCHTGGGGGGNGGGGTGPDVWTSPKLIDSGFSTETNKSSPTNKSDEEDPLYSLLDLIQLKVSSTTSTANQGQVHNCCSHCTNLCEVCQPGAKTYVANSKRRTSGDGVKEDGEGGSGGQGFQLGRLDHVLEFRGTSDDLDDCSQVTISRKIIGAVLREVNVVELQRQILFGINRVKTLEARLHNLQSTTSESRLASKYLALSQENEQLRFKLKEQEIQLVGTKARLRILERLKEAAAQVASVPGGGSSSAVSAYPSASTLNADGHNSVEVEDDKGRAFSKGYSSTTGSPISSNPPEPAPRKCKTLASGRSSPSNVLLQSSYVIEEYNGGSEEFYAAEVVPVHHHHNESSTSVTNFSRKNSRNDKVGSLIHSNVISNNNVSGNSGIRLSRLSNNGGSQREDGSKDNLILREGLEERSGIRNEHLHRRSNSSSPSHHQLNNSWGKSPQIYCIGGGGKPNGLDKGYLTNLHSNSNSNSSSGLSGCSGKSGLPSSYGGGNTMNHRPSRIPVTTSRPNTPGKKVQPPTPPKSLSSISSKSSIPIPVTRLKRSQSSNSRNSTTSNKNKMGQFWAQWFG